MSLVVARRIADEVRIISDTKISNPLALHQTPLTGALKCIVVSPTCCISFVGNIYIAEGALTPLLQGAISTRRELTSYLLGQHRQHGCQTDFIVTTVGEATAVDRISMGSLEEGLPSAWIGDVEAFEAYQANYHTTLTRRQASPYFDERFRIAGAMSDALDAVIDDSGIESVGDFTVSVSSQPAQGDGFRYLSRAFGSGFKPVANTTEETSLTQSVGVEGGSYHYCLLVPTAAGVGALAVHIREARLGILFFPARSWTSILLKGLDVKSFIHEIRARFGITFDGLRV